LSLGVPGCSRALCFPFGPPFCLNCKGGGGVQTLVGPRRGKAPGPPWGPSPPFFFWDTKNWRTLFPFFPPPSKSILPLGLWVSRVSFVFWPFFWGVFTDIFFFGLGGNGPFQNFFPPRFLDRGFSSLPLFGPTSTLFIFQTFFCFAFLFFFPSHDHNHPLFLWLVWPGLKPHAAPPYHPQLGFPTTFSAVFV